MDDITHIVKELTVKLISSKFYLYSGSCFLNNSLKILAEDIVNMSLYFTKLSENYY